jgi:hypothetical protein
VSTQRFPVTDATLGWEHVVALAVEASNPRLDLRYLEQPSLDTLGTRGATVRSPFQRLLDRSVFGGGNTRGLTSADAGKHAIRMLSWRTQKQ